MHFRHTCRVVITAYVLLWTSFAVAQQRNQPGVVGDAVLWTDPGDIRARDLFWGPGGQKRQPQPPAEFIEEDRHGTSPKFDLRDSAGTKWRAKLGIEVGPEVVASRLLWAVGYAANENYFLPHLHVEKMPSHLRRGKNLLGTDGDLSNVRLRRRPHGEKKTATWNWRHNPFVGTREFNGLRVMMALLRNWDLYDDNNAILEDDSGHKVYEVSDVGTAFGATGRHRLDRDSRNNLPAYRKGRLISSARPDYIDLHFPTLPWPGFIFDLPFYRYEMRARWVGKHIPRSDAKWIGSLLAQLSPDQIRDAFRAGGYSPEQIDAFADILTSRIEELNRL
ncbi:MAG: hypothetical protein JOY79_00375 [Acidobacteriaceae bacterium]|nr:hypothetical protein [Acidobacteriaceae bacterium]